VMQLDTGVEDGMVIRVAGAGDRPVGASGTTGDLLIQVQVASSRQFRRQGSNLLQSVRIPLHTALLGGKVRVPTLDGEVDIKIAAGTQPGEECVLKGRGVPSVRGGSKGDMFVSFQVQIPR
jgi:molecular chaperone DnaJ